MQSLPGGAMEPETISRSRPHPVVAGVFDFYTASLVLGAALATVTTLTSEPLSVLFALAAVGVSLLGSILYHAAVARWIGWRSPGEAFAGKTILEGRKEWVNPYRSNRFVLFFVSLLIVAVAGNAWDGLSEGAVFTVWNVVARVLTCSVCIGGLVAVGSGRAWGVVLVAAYLLLIGATASRDPRVGNTLLLVFASLAVVYLVVVLIQSIIARRRGIGRPAGRDGL